MHHPVLLKKVIEGLDIKKEGLYIDATFGAGGYTKEILKKEGSVLAIDLDKDQILSFKNKDLKFKLVHGNFAEIESIAKKNDFYPVDGVIFDLGLSMRQLNESKRGFSYKRDDEILDMRIDLSQKIRAIDLIRKLTKEELTEIFSKYSEEINSKKIAEEIKKSKDIETVFDLKKIIDQTLGFKSEKTYARIFQALRIAVNNELENLKKGLEGALKIVKKGGKIVVISFHSLEDRIVKRFVKEKRLKFASKKPIFGSFSYERSAKLRIILV